MSKLDDILSPQPDTAAGQSIRFKADPVKKQQIKALMLELIGEDDNPDIGHHDDSDWEWCAVCDSLTYEGEDGHSWCLCHQKNKWRAELRQKVEAL